MAILAGVIFVIVRTVSKQINAIRQVRKKDQLEEDENSNVCKNFQLFDNDKQINEFKLLSKTSPEIIASVMNEFIQEDISEEEGNETEELIESGV